MELSNRLKAVADMVTIGNVAADIGCDHAFAAIYLIQHQICPRVIATDVNKGPLERARKHIALRCLDSYIEVRLSDGLKAVKPHEADTFLCAGMGGRLTIKILQEGAPQTACVKEVILQPQSEIHLVRAYLRQHGFTIMAEAMILEDGKFYPIIKAIPLSNEDIADIGFLPIFDYYGEHLLTQKNPVLFTFLCRKQEALAALLTDLKVNTPATEKKTKRITQLCEESARVEEALKWY